MSEDLARVLAEGWSNLGPAGTLTRLSFPFAVSNEIWRYDTVLGSFIVKRIVASDALYGHPDTASRLDLVGRATALLRKSGLPVERIIAGAGGSFVSRDREGLTRVYEREDARHYDASPADAALAAYSLRRLHQEGLAALPAEIATELGRLQTAYPLATTAPHLAELRRFAEEQRLEAILAGWGLLERSVERALGYQPRSPVERVVVHTDVHPRNVLYTEHRAVLIDCDNLLVDRPFKCLGFSILRFSEDQTTARLKASLEAWVQQADRAWMADLIHGMVELEAEKATRILFRVLRTGTYRGFVDNVAKLHLANLAAIEPQWTTWCS